MIRAHTSDIFPWVTNGMLCDIHVALCRYHTQIANGRSKVVEILDSSLKFLTTEYGMNVKMASPIPALVMYFTYGFPILTGR